MHILGQYLCRCEILLSFTSGVKNDLNYNNNSVFLKQSNFNLQNSLSTPNTVSKYPCMINFLLTRHLHSQQSSRHCIAIDCGISKYKVPKNVFLCSEGSVSSTFF